MTQIFRAILAAEQQDLERDKIELQIPERLEVSGNVTVSPELVIQAGLLLQQQRLAKESDGQQPPTAA